MLLLKVLLEDLVVVLVDGLVVVLVVGLVVEGLAVLVVDGLVVARVAVDLLDLTELLVELKSLGDAELFFKVLDDLSDLTV